MVKIITKPSGKKYLYIIFPLLLFVAISVLGLSLKYGKMEANCGCGDPLTGDGGFIPEQEAYFLDQEIVPLLTELPDMFASPVLGDASPDSKWIEIDLSEQKLIAWENGNKFLETLISSGKTGKTPEGDFRIWSKYKYTKMSGGSKELHTYYYLPNVPYTMYFFKDYGLHGTYWHNNFGHPMSHGCVNLPTVMAEKIFYWSTPSLPSEKNSILASKDSPGTRVVIHQ